MFFGTSWEHHTCLYTYHVLIIKYLNTILCYSEEIAQALYNYPTIEPQMDDFSFIQTRIARQYINQYNATYPRS